VHAAALELSTGDEREDESVTANLIRDIATVFITTNSSRLKTADLLAGLSQIEESPWGDWHGKSLTPHDLSRLLKPYRIKTMPVRVGSNTVRGYKVEQFADAFAQLAVEGVMSVTSVTSEDSSQSDVTLVTPRQEQALLPDPSIQASSNAGNAYPAGEGDAGLDSPRQVPCVCCDALYTPGENGSGPVTCRACHYGNRKEKE
jgi:hypothetical protein